MLLATHRGPPIDLDEDEDTAAPALTLGTAVIQAFPGFS